MSSLPNTFLDEEEQDILNERMEEIEEQYNGSLSENQLQYIQGRLKQQLENSKFRSLI